MQYIIFQNIQKIRPYVAGLFCWCFVENFCVCVQRAIVLYFPVVSLSEFDVKVVVASEKVGKCDLFFYFLEEFLKHMLILL